MNDLKSIFEFIRIRDQIFIVLAVLIGNFLHSFTLDATMLTLLAFIISIMSFTFIINNISDVKIDRLNKKSENSITRKEISLPFAKFLLVLFLLISIIFAFLLPDNLFYLSLILILISLTYSFFIKAKSRPPLDLIYHGLSPAIVFIMISSFYVQFDFAILLSTIIIFNMFLIIQLLQEIRDFDADKKFIKTTAIVLGKRNSIKLAIFLLVSLLFIVLAGVIISIFPIKSLVYFPLSYFLFEPLYTSLKNKKSEKLLLYYFRKRLTQVAIIFFILFLVINFI